MLTNKLYVGTGISLCLYNLFVTYYMDLQYHIPYQKTQGEVQNCMISYIFKLGISTVRAQVSKKIFHFEFSETLLTSVFFSFEY